MFTEHQELEMSEQARPVPVELHRLTPSQYAIAFGIPVSTVRLWLSRGELPGAMQDPETRVWSIPVGARRGGYVEP